MKKPSSLLCHVVVHELPCKSFFSVVWCKGLQISQEVSKAHIPLAVAIRGCNTFRETLNLKTLALIGTGRTATEIPLERKKNE